MIDQNPFRILGLPITATDREIAKQIADLEIYAEMGKNIEFDSDFYFSTKPNRSIESIKEAKQQIDQPDNKLFYALFWFWEDTKNTIDTMAFEELKSRNTNKAIQFWELETGGSINSKNISNHKNLSTLHLGLSNQNGKFIKRSLLISLSHFGEFIANGYYKEFASQILGIKHSVDLMEIANNYVSEIISTMKPYISSKISENRVTYKELLDYFKKYPASTRNTILNNFIGKQIYNIEQQVRKSKEQLKNNEKIANEIGYNLYKNTEDDLKLLKAVLLKSDLKYQFIADKLAEELLNCSIAYFNKFYDTKVDPSGDALKLAKDAEKIVVGDKVKARINNNMITFNKFIDEKPFRETTQPFISKMEKFNSSIELQKRTNSDRVYEVTKNFVFDIKQDLDCLRGALSENKLKEEHLKYIKEVISACAITVNACGVYIANGYAHRYGQAIELVDMATRILIYKTIFGNGLSANHDIALNLISGRETLSKNITQSSGLLTRGIGGLVRASKGNVLCGCGSGKKLNQCCSV